LANFFTISGTVLVAAGAICFMLSAWPYNLICVAMMAVGMAFVIGGTLLGYDAMDSDPRLRAARLPYPPVLSVGIARLPGRRSRVRADADGRRVEAPCKDDHPPRRRSKPLNSLTSLMRRFAAA
jgi:hypothetical protein